MALIQVNFMSQSLMRTVPINVILPIDKITFPGMPVREEKPFKTLYLLHGIFGNYTDWLCGSNIRKWAEEKNLAVVMPSGDNMFYVDQEAGHNYYGEFIGKELVEITRKMFPLSHRWEDTFIAGLSMGGYGAIRNGLKYHDTFGYIVGLSSAMIIDGLLQRTNDYPIFIERKEFAESIFGNLELAVNSDKNPEWLVNQLSEKQTEFPKMYLACGTEDSLLEPNRRFAKVLKEAGVELTYEEGPGGHEWDFWNRYIKKALDWLPLEEEGQAGIDSGNVGI